MTQSNQTHLFNLKVSFLGRKALVYWRAFL